MSQENEKETKKVINNEPNDNRQDNKTKEEIEKEKSYVPVPSYKSLIPYPQRIAKSKTEGQFKKFVELLKQLNITVPFTEAITQMPSYSKFLKEILSNNKKLKNNE